MLPARKHGDAKPSHRVGVLAIWLAFVTVALYMLFTSTRISTDMSSFLPHAATQRQSILVGQLRHGPATRIIMVALKGGSPAVLAEASGAFAEKLVATNTFDLVANGAIERRLQDRSWLFEHRYLLSPAVTVEQFTADGLVRALNATRELLGTPMGDFFRPLAARDPTGELWTILSAMNESQGPAMREGVWFDSKGDRALLLLQIQENAATIEAQSRIKKEIEVTFASVGAPGVRLTLAGPAIYAVESRNVIERESLLLTLVAVGMIVGLLAWVYRNAWQMLLVFAPAATGILAAIVLVSWYFGSVHGITLAFAITLLGEAIDYPSYLFLQARPGVPLDEEREIWPTLRLAVLTTIVGSLAMLFSSIQGLSQLGLLAVIGIAVAGLVNRWAIPALWAVRKVAPPRFPSPPDWLRNLLEPRFLHAVAFSLLALVSLAMTGFGWQDDLGALNPLPVAMKQLDRELRTELGAPDVRYVVALPAPDLESALRGSEKLRPALAGLIKDKLISGHEMAADYLPSEATQQARLDVLPPRDRLDADLRRAAQTAGYRPGALSPFVDEITKASQLPLVTLGNINDKAWKLRTESLLARDSGDVVALITLKGVIDGGALVAHAPELAPAVLIDLRQEISDLVAGYRLQILIYSCIGMVLIAVLLFAHLRSSLATFRVLVPPLLGILFTLAVLALIGERVSLFHLVALLLVLGVGINYALFFNQRAKDRPRADRILFSLLVCLISTSIGFGILAFSTTQVLHAIGVTAFSGTVSSFFFSAWLAPASKLSATAVPA
jgi:predicted exporter